MQSKVETISDEEKYFQSWLDEAVKEGLVERYKYQPKPFTLFNEIAFPTLKKSGKVDKANVIMKEHTYQADYLILWTKKAFEINLVKDFSDNTVDAIFLTREHQSLCSIVDVKGSFGQNKNDQRFPLNQKWVFSKHKYFVQKIVPFGSSAMKSCLFYKTWTPKDYAFRLRKDGKGHLTVYVDTVRMIDEYLNSK